MILSVILPVYNAEKYVTEAIRSVLNQTFTDFEFIIINDGSKDRSKEMIQVFKDSRITFINQENRGLAKTLNYGLSIAKGKYIARMDADDICMSTRFEQQIKYLESHPDTGLLGTAVQVISDEGEHLWYNPPITSHKILTKVMLTQGNPIKHPSVMFRKDLAIECGGYNEDIGKYFEDYMLWRLMAMKCKIENLPKILLSYRVTSSSIISTMKNDVLDNFVIKTIKKGSFDDHDKVEWHQILGNLKKNLNNEDRNFNSKPTRKAYHKVIDIGYRLFGDNILKLISELKKIKYLNY